MKGSEGGIDERATIELMPGEVDRGTLLAVQEGTGVVEVCWSAGSGKLERVGQLGYLRKRRECLGGVREGFQVPCVALLIDDGKDGCSDS